MSIFSERFTPARRLDGIALSDITQIKQRAAGLARQGRDVIDLSIGEPDFDTPTFIQNAASAAMARGETHYTSMAGTLELRLAIARKIERDNNRTVQANQIIVGVGAKQVIANAMLASLEPGDEVIIPTPYWSNYVDMVRFAGGTPVFVPCSSATGFLMGPKQLEAAITPRTKWLLLNSPSNPSGACYTKDQLATLVPVLESHSHIGILEDAIYEHIIYDSEKYWSLLDISPALADRTLWVNGVSKAYAMTGWRIGYGVGPKALIDAMAVVSAQTTSHPCSIAQAAAAAALDGDQAPVAAFRETFGRRRDLICSALSRVPGLEIVRPRGAFYIFANVQDLLRENDDRSTFDDDRSLADYLLETAGVAVVPGSSFGAPGHFRLSFAASEKALSEAGGRILSALALAKATPEPVQAR